MHIAIIHEELPWPAISGASTRILSLISSLTSHGIKVTLIIGSNRQINLQPPPSFIKNIEIFKPKGIINSTRRAKKTIDEILEKNNLPTIDGALRLLFKKILSKKTPNYWKRCPQGLDEFVLKLHKENKYDAIFVEYIWMHPSIELVRNKAPLILDMHDLMHKRAEIFSNHGKKLPLKITKAKELEILDSFDAVIAIQENEAKEIESNTKNTTVLRVGVDSYNPISLCIPDDQPRILYIGGDNPCNTDGLTWFLERVWPSISKKNPSAELTIAGMICKSIQKPHDNKKIRLVGFVDKIDYLYKNSNICINPINFGSGLKIKTIEALGRGRALITTPVGIEGINPSPSNACIVAKNSSEWISALDNLCKNAELRNSISLHAQQYARQWLSQDHIYKELIDWIKNDAPRLKKTS